MRVFLNCEAVQVW